jgi:hemerythrin-like metal-binding protein
MPSRFEWTPELLVGVKAIDEQHQALFKDTRRLLAAWENNEPRETLTPIIDGLSDAIQVHFATEESLMRGILDEYEGFAEHLETHTEFLTRSIDFLLKYHQNQEQPSKELLGNMLQWWIEHITLHDKELGERLRSLGYA